MLLTPNFRDVLSELSDAQAEYLVVGAWAMTAYQMRRSTGDLDIWVRPTPENAIRVWNGLASFGAPLADYHITLEELAKPGLVFQIGVDDDSDRIDVLTAIDGLGFDEAWQTREYHPVDGIVVPVLSVPCLLKNKRSTGRPKDMYDVDWIERKYGPDGTGR